MEERKWYQKKRYIAVMVFVAIWGIAHSGIGEVIIDSPSQANVVESVKTSNIPSSRSTVTNAESHQYAQPRSSVNTTNLSNNNYYINVDGNTVHSPVYTSDNSVPAGATALCRNGKYSFSQHRQGTCSRQGGVAKWLY